MNNLQSTFGSFENSKNVKSPVIISRKSRGDAKAFIYLNILGNGVMNLEVTSKFLDGPKYFPGPTQKVETEIPAHIGEYLTKCYQEDKVVAAAPEDFNDFLESIWQNFVFGQDSWKN